MIYLTTSYGYKYKTDTDTFITENITDIPTPPITDGNINSLNKFHYDVSLKTFTGCKFYTYNGYLVYIEGKPEKSTTIKLSDYFRGIYATAFMLLHFAKFTIILDNKLKYPDKMHIIPYNTDITLDCTELNRDTLYEIMSSYTRYDKIICDRNTKNEIVYELSKGGIFFTGIDDIELANRIAKRLNNEMQYVDKLYDFDKDSFMSFLSLQYNIKDEIDKNNISFLYMPFLDEIEAKNKEFADIVNCYRSIVGVADTDLFLELNNLILYELKN